jgi:hypothetical protein
MEIKKGEMEIFHWIQLSDHYKLAVNMVTIIAKGANVGEVVVGDDAPMCMVVVGHHGSR